jgi:hypothetical protein
MGLVMVFVVLKQLEKMRQKRKEKEGKREDSIFYVTSGKSRSSSSAPARQPKGFDRGFSINIGLKMVRDGKACNAT